MSVRVYVPSTLALLRGIVTADGVGPAPLAAHAVTDALRAAWPDGGEEEWEYAASAAAAQSSLGLLTDEDEPRRVVVAVDVGSARPAPGDDDVTLVVVDEVVPFRRIAAVLADDLDACDEVAAAVQALPEALAGDAEAERVVERCLDHELGWWATQEIGDLLEQG